MNSKILGAAAFLALFSVTALAQPPAPPPVPAPAAPRADGPMRHREMRPITRAAFEQRLRTHFARLDANRDGFVDRAEAGTAMAERHGGAAGRPGDAPRPPHPRMDPNAAFDRIDANRDGSVSRSEFLAFHAARRGHFMHGPMAGGDAAPMAGPDGAPPPMRTRHAGMGMGFGGRWFDRVDADHDGRVSLAELDRAALAMFDRLDANHDGTTGPDERASARQRLRQRMDERRAQ
ncbi:MAG: hypothetical protein QOH81_321 [Sphingomonadales bacterium]|jgi:Ca2+-binding EF-hand superfamily protein|nr:hypothetical protein [Sphingomonadales bacterium]